MWIRSALQPTSTIPEYVRMDAQVDRYPTASGVASEDASSLRKTPEGASSLSTPTSQSSSSSVSKVSDRSFPLVSDASTPSQAPPQPATLASGATQDALTGDVGERRTASSTHKSHASELRTCAAMAAQASYSYSSQQDSTPSWRKKLEAWASRPSPRNGAYSSAGRPRVGSAASHLIHPFNSAIGAAAEPLYAQEAGAKWAFKPVSSSRPNDSLTSPLVTYQTPSLALRTLSPARERSLSPHGHRSFPSPGSDCAHEAATAANVGLGATDIALLHSDIAQQQDPHFRLEHRAHGPSPTRHRSPSAYRRVGASPLSPDRHVSTPITSAKTLDVVHADSPASHTSSTILDGRWPSPALAAPLRSPLSPARRSPPGSPSMWEAATAAEVALGATDMALLHRSPPRRHPAYSSGRHQQRSPSPMRLRSPPPPSRHSSGQVSPGKLLAWDASTAAGISTAASGRARAASHLEGWQRNEGARSNEAVMTSSQAGVNLELADLRGLVVSLEERLKWLGESVVRQDRELALKDAIIAENRSQLLQQGEAIRYLQKQLQNGHQHPHA
ncbi:hypothetical protein CYMTET_26178 [Cymbomonas tetramitiformis]|uniref:Uncharacterized protein n=1 Tax=Cymbomonas tetramitiformis TaxID=36881 RepID=A0AAE0FSA4_9CHLO|nr:hypothetical protein CYMTET_26178 [Cymbomonas tetramitiformis]